MFKINFRSEEGEGDLSCPFCDLELGLPFGIRLSADANTDPTPAHIINEHYNSGIVEVDSEAIAANDPDIVQINSVAIERCPNWNAWRTSIWELHDLDVKPTLIQAGEVTVHRNRAIEVSTTYRKS
jgi:hypothetical protein